MEIWQNGNLEQLKFGKLEIWKNETLEKWKLGNMEIWKNDIGEKLKQGEKQDIISSFLELLDDKKYKMAYMCTDIYDGTILVDQMV